MTTRGFDPNESFRREAAELIEQLENALLRIEEGDHSRQIVDEAFRAMHTIKGSGAMFGFERVAEFTHHFETAFDKVRAGDVPVSEQLTDCAMQALDYIKAMLADRYDDTRAQNIITQLNKAVGSQQSHSGKTAPDHKLLDRHVTAKSEATSSGEGHDVVAEKPHCFKITFYPNQEMLKYGGNPALLLDELRDLGSTNIKLLTDRFPDWEVFDPQVCYMGWEIILTTDKGRAAIDDVFLFSADNSELHIESLANGETDTEPREKNADIPAAGTPPKVDTTIRIPAERLDSMMDQVGELVIAQSRLAELIRAESNPELLSVSEDIERLVTELRDQTLDVRMLPIGMLFSKFKRVVRDLSKELEKSVELVTEGEETEVDKSYIEKLSDPIVHLIRNSMDHGIENPAARTLRNKPEKGIIRLSAQQSGGEVLIRIQDDGRGLDVERIRAKAIENNLISEQDELSDEQIHNLIFEAGFSTAQTVSSVSGRGVGMDVVRRAIEEIRGKIDVDSIPGAGSTFTLRLPLTLAIIEGYHVKVGNEVFVMPLELVEECVELSPRQDQESKGRNLITIRNEFVPFIRLHDEFGYEYPPDRVRRVVVVRVGKERTGLVVDHIFGQRQTVIKPLSRLHAGIPGLAGATILGDGRVALILDVPALLHKTRKPNKFEAKVAV